mgnify:CR=1 FL=1
MGTSQSHNLKSSPNWSAEKRAMTSLANGTDNKPASNAKFFGNLGIALGMEVREAAVRLDVLVDMQSEGWLLF